MKRIFSLTIFVAMQLACLAQANPKLESLYAYLKANGLVKSYTLSNKNQEGVRKRYTFNFGLNNEGPAPTKDYMGKPLDEKEDSAIRAKWRETREAFKVIRRTLGELTEDAAESYSYEYHQWGHDTIITNIALKTFNNDVTPILMKYPFLKINGMGKIPEMVNFRYTDSDRGLKNRMGPIGFGELNVNTIVDTTLYATENFDVDKLQKAIAPLLKDKNIKRREIHCQHDSTFDVFAFDEKNFIEGFRRCTKYRSRGDNHLTAYKFTSEERAKTVLHQVMECVRQHIADHPRQAYTICSDEYFPPLNSEEMFRGEPFKEPFSDNGIRKSMTIDTLMDEHGFYILINVWEDDEAFPGDWKRQKEMVNGKIVYYSVNDWWP
jgi:hypothetical protein